VAEVPRRRVACRSRELSDSIALVV
jgi:hypothetical protein